MGTNYVQRLLNRFTDSYHLWPSKWSNYLSNERFGAALETYLEERDLVLGVKGRPGLPDIHRIYCTERMSALVLDIIESSTKRRTVTHCAMRWTKYSGETIHPVSVLIRDSVSSVIVEDEAIGVNGDAGCLIVSDNSAEAIGDVDVDSRGPGEDRQRRHFGTKANEGYDVSQYKYTSSLYHHLNDKENLMNDVHLLHIEMTVEIH
ncbi:hypothetical protein P152DRAFT_502465 [Eremomyces bilateralis CBS 781.70]|uniref:Uncharacterized protein n=1 Tax=Eremomyces bilateralis CBS 781.70 TaxID=1392243 RepID=A0A6G1G5P9_9PEZI|nr:uncharacterized protein P152DRAFT_502465 [Eremomyces bilateralis CBS 781.70]KAF1813271.1 hypothetical protein P152DRAFT_502465 [Eremomyces bilateralis CBS 781.70]